MRLFTGISLPPPILETMRQSLDALRPSAPDLLWYPAANLHITTKFIGSWPEERFDELDQALAALHISGTMPIHVARYGYFPNPHRPHTFFAGVRPVPELLALHAAINHTVTTLGHPPEPRDYVPHLTLARIKGHDITGLRLHIAKHGAPEFGTFSASAFHLFESVPGPNGSAYNIMKTYPLKEAA